MKTRKTILYNGKENHDKVYIVAVEPHTTWFNVVAYYGRREARRLNRVVKATTRVRQVAIETANQIVTQKFAHGYEIAA